MPIKGRFQGLNQGLNAPIERIEPVSPDDAIDLNESTSAINVSTSGTVQVTTLRGDTGTVFIAADIPFPIRIQRI